MPGPTPPPFYKENPFWGGVGAFLALVLAGLGFGVDGQLTLGRVLLWGALPAAFFCLWLARAAFKSRSLRAASIVVGVLAFSLLFWKSDRYLVRRGLEDRLKDAYTHLDIDLTIPGQSTDIRASELRLVNRGNNDLVRFTRFCVIREVTFADGRRLRGNDLPGNGLGAAGEFYTGFQTLRADGGTDTTQCLQGLDSLMPPPGRPQLVCADINVEAGYVLPDAPDDRRWKSQRYVLNNTPRWIPELDDGTGTTCTNDPPAEISLPHHFNIEPANPDNTSWTFQYEDGNSKPEALQLKKANP